MRVAVTGAAGFLGGAVARAHLAAGHEVVALSRAGTELTGVTNCTGDLADAAYLGRALVGVDLVQHLAARTRPTGRWRLFLRDNVGATERLLAAAARAGVQGFVYCSSASVVGHRAPIRGGDERLPRLPLPYDPLACSKSMAEQAVERDAVHLGLSAIILRPTLVWGPGDRRVMAGLPRLGGRGRLVRATGVDPTVDAAYVDDAAEAHLLAGAHLVAERPAMVARAFVTGPEPVGLWDLVARVVEAATGHPPSISEVPVGVARLLGMLGSASSTGRGDAATSLTRSTVEATLHDRWFSPAGAAQTFGYRGRTTVEDGLRALAAARS